MDKQSPDSVKQSGCAVFVTETSTALVRVTRIVRFLCTTGVVPQTVKQGP